MIPCELIFSILMALAVALGVALLLCVKQLNRRRDQDALSASLNRKPTYRP